MWELISLFLGSVTLHLFEQIQGVLGVLALCILKPHTQHLNLSLNFMKALQS